ncbi:MAG: serine/threonine protein kinase [Myxococcales bacterium]|nr:serine/threonine protein kinase [Myxococcales bacterium]
MTASPLDPALQQRMTEILAELDDTVAVDATIGRSLSYGGLDQAALPRFSLDEGGHREVTASGAGLSTRGADLQLVGVLGKGGMGVVYAARQRALGREVAVKRPHSDAVSAQAQESLVAEARVMGALEHPNIVPVHALGCDADGLPVLVMKRVDGVAWRELLRDGEHPMWEQLGGAHQRGLPFHLHVLASVCNALRLAHDRGVVHRDVKPENVMIGAFGEVYLLDWGIACPISTVTDERVVGTPAYMAPEMVLDPSAADTRTDVYLLGATLHEVLTGRTLHQGRSVNEVLCAVMLSKPRDANVYEAAVPSDLAALCVAATHPDPVLRTPSVDAFRDALVAHGAHRASHVIALSAQAKLSEAEQRLHGGDEALEANDVAVLLAEGRFGFAQSLQQWPDNALARAGLQRCLERSCERELRLRNGPAASALLAALPAPNPQLASQVRSLEQELLEARRLEQDNARLAAAMDAKVSAWPRFLFMAAFLLFGTGASTAAYLEEQRTGQAMTIQDQMMLDGAILTFFTVGLLFMRRRLLTNTFNRITWGLWYLAVVGVTVSDAYLGSVGVTSTEATPNGFGIVALVFTVGTVTAIRQLAPVAVTLWVTTVLAARFPPESTLIATIGLFLSIVVNMEVTRRAGLAR